MSEKPVLPAKTSLIPTIVKAIPTLFVLSVMFGGWLIVHRINEGGQAPHRVAADASDAASSDTLTLPSGKLEAAQFEAVPAESRPIQHVHTVPGRIRYDDAKHVDVKAPMDGILAEMLVTPGEQVESGQLLAVLRSAEIGQARAEILKRQHGQRGRSGQRCARGDHVRDRQRNGVRRGGGCQIERAHRVAIHRGVVERGQGMRRAHRFAQRAATHIRHVDPLWRKRRGRVQAAGAGLSEGEQARRHPRRR